MKLCLDIFFIDFFVDIFRALNPSPNNNTKFINSFFFFFLVDIIAKNVIIHNK